MHGAGWVNNKISVRKLALLQSYDSINESLEGKMVHSFGFINTIYFFSKPLSNMEKVSRRPLKYISYFSCYVHVYE